MGEGKQIARTVPGGQMVAGRDATANDSDKTIITVPANKLYRLFSLEAQLTTTATVGNRFMKILITDGTNNRYLFYSAAVTAAPSVGAMLAQSGMAYATNNKRVLDDSGNSTTAVWLPVPIEGFWLPAGWTVRVMDSAAVDAAADDLTVIWRYESFDV